MSNSNKPHVDLSFDMIRQYIKSSVPPCEVASDTPTHYEAVAVNGDQKHLFAYVVAHQHVVTLGFSTDISDADFRELIPERLRKMMNEHRRLEIHNAHVDDLREDIQDACEQLLYYYNQKGWTK